MSNILSESHKQAAKEQILGNIRRALSIHNPIKVPEIPRDYLRTSPEAPGSEKVLEVFVDALEDYNAKVEVIAPEEIPAAVARALPEAKRVVIPEGLDRSWVEKLGQTEIMVDKKGKPFTNHELDQMDAVITASRCAVSHTGTIMLDGESDQGRRAISLVPDTHVCIVYADTVYPTVPQAVEILAKHPQRACTWFAGPSATADIELIRVDGVHGPRNLHVLIVKR